MSEEEIILGLLNQEANAIDGLVELLGYRIQTTIKFVLNNSIEINEITEVENATYYRIWEKISQFDNEKANFITWCLTIARNLALDKKRKLVKQQNLSPIEDVEEMLEDETQKPLATERFLDLVKSLKPMDQLIFLEHYFYGETIEQIAERLKLSTDIIYNHLSRGRKSLKEVLQNE
jgi:RNA polymerase sigma-70 factor (ECF subfamily)